MYFANYLKLETEVSLKSNFCLLAFWDKSAFVIVEFPYLNLDSELGDSLNEIDGEKLDWDTGIASLIFGSTSESSLYLGDFSLN